MALETREIDRLFDPEVVQNPHDYYRELRENDPVHEVAGTGTFLVTRMDLIHQVVNQPDLYSSASGEFLHKGDWDRPGLRPANDSYSPELAGGAVANADPPDHERQRRVVARKLSNASMRQMEPEFRTLVEEVLARAVDDGHIEWMSSIAEPLPMVMVTRILGLDDSMAPQLKRQGYAMVERISGLVPEDRIQVLEDAGINDLAPVIETYLKAKDDPTIGAHGLIGTVAEAVHSGELNDVEALGILSVLIAAGGESTTSLTGTAARLLAEQPSLQTALRDDPSLVPNFIEEALRFDPPFRGHYRVATRNSELAGTAIPAGSHLVLMWPAANRDPAVYDHPDQVRLDRENPRYHVGFGWGIHLCVGAPLARIEARVAVESLLRTTRWFRIDTDQPPLRYHPSLLVRRLTALPLILEPRT